MIETKTVIKPESPLYRQEAIQHGRGSFLGSVFVIQPLSHKIYVAVALISVITVGALLWLGSYDRKAKVSGYVASSLGVAKVQAHSVGMVTEVLITLGQSVAAGAPLFIVSYERDLAQGPALYERQTAALDAQLTLLQASRDSTVRRAELDRQRLEAQADRLKQQLERSRQQIEIQQRRLKMASEQLERYSGLRDKGYFSKVRYQEELDLVLNHEQTVQSMLQERIAMTSNLANLHSELAKLPAIHLEQLADIDRHLAVLRGQSAEVDASNVLQYRSPVTGTVTGLQIQPGVTVRPNLPLVSILPANSQIYAQLHVPTRAAGFLNVGQPVKIRYAAFPHQRYGSYLGEVTHIARTILFPNELGMTVPLNEPVYQVHVALAEFSILGYGQRWPLQVGMQLEADIVLDERRFLDWLLDPILSLRGKLA